MARDGVRPLTHAYVNAAFYALANPSPREQGVSPSTPFIHAHQCGGAHAASHQRHKAADACHQQEVLMPPTSILEASVVDEP